MPKQPAHRLSVAFKHLEVIANTHEGRQIARTFGEQCADMRIYDALRLSRLLEASFVEGKKVGANQAKAAAIDALKKLA